MKTYNKLQLVFTSLLFMALTVQFSVAQTYQLSNSSSTLQIDGTSNIHDWSIVAKQQDGEVVVKFEDGKLISIAQLNFAVMAESLKSGKSSMDKNTYKALNTGKYKKIVYKLNKVNRLDCPSNGSCKVNATGSLTINGVTKNVEINFNVKASESKIVFSGSKTINMTDYGIEPPTAVFGTITTGDTVVVKFDSIFIK